MSLGTEEKQAQGIIEAALEAGINYFDTADLYDYGMNEKIVGKSLKNVRDKVIIATKAGNRWYEDKSGWRWDASKAYIKEAAKQSLKRLGTDYIDLFQLHGGTMEDPIDETIEAFEELKEEGYIRYYGISSIRPTVIREYANRSSIVSVMMQYSLLDRRPEEQVFPLLEEKGIHVVARGPVARGLLSEKLLEKANEAMKEKGYVDYRYSELEQILPKLKEKAAEFGYSMNALALQYVLSNPVVSSAVCGASSIQQLQENVKAIEARPLTEDELEILKSMTKAQGYQAHRL